MKCRTAKTLCRAIYTVYESSNCTYSVDGYISLVTCNIQGGWVHYFSDM